MLSTPGIVLVAVLVVLVVAAGIVGSRFASAADDAMREREAERVTEAPLPRAARPSRPRRPRRR